MVVCCTLELLNEETLHAWRPNSLSEVCGGFGCSSLSLKKTGGGGGRLRLYCQHTCLGVGGCRSVCVYIRVCAFDGLHDLCVSFDG